MIKRWISGPKPVDHAGKKFGYLTAIKWVSRGPTRWLCRCRCGKEVTVLVDLLTKGKTKSCGCFRREKLKQIKTTHGHAGTRDKSGIINRSSTYAIWRAMHSRCENPNVFAYERYGGRGIKVCARWKSFENFLADMGERPIGCQIDRVNNEGNYEPSNCIWNTPSGNARNRASCIYVNWNEKRQTLTEVCQKENKDYFLVWNRYKNLGWSLEKALYTPVRGNAAGL